MNHEKAQELLNLLAVDPAELSADQREAMAAHLRDCAECRDSFAELRQTCALLRKSLASDLDETLSEDRLETIFRYDSTEPAPEAHPVPGPFQISFAQWIQIAAVLVITAVVCSTSMPSCSRALSARRLAAVSAGVDAAVKQERQEPCLDLVTESPPLIASGEIAFPAAGEAAGMPKPSRKSGSVNGAGMIGGMPAESEPLSMGMEMGGMGGVPRMEMDESRKRSETEGADDGRVSSSTSVLGITRLGRHILPGKAMEPAPMDRAAVGGTVIRPLGSGNGKVLAPSPAEVSLRRELKEQKLRERNQAETAAREEMSAGTRLAQKTEAIRRRPAPLSPESPPPEPSPAGKPTVTASPAPPVQVLAFGATVAGGPISGPAASVPPVVFHDDISGLARSVPEKSEKKDETFAFPSPGIPHGVKAKIPKAAGPSAGNDKSGTLPVPFVPVTAAGNVRSTVEDADGDGLSLLNGAVAGDSKSPMFIHAKEKVEADGDVFGGQNQTPAASAPQLYAQASDALRRNDRETASEALNQLLVEFQDTPEAARGLQLSRELRRKELLTPADRDSSIENLPAAPPGPPPPVNPFVMTADDRFSTFSLEADTASYTLMRRYIRSGYLPPAGLVRMEEFINAFDYHYPAQTEKTFIVQAEGAPAPFGHDLTLLKIGVKGKVVGRDGRKTAHFVFVVDASGSMAREDRMPLVKYALRTLLDQLDPSDLISLITYGTRTRLIREAVPAQQKADLVQALEAIECGTSTNIQSGIELGYELAARHFTPGTVNRVILCSDGVANVGTSDAVAILDRIEQYRRQGITLTCVGVGSGSYDDRFLEQLANKGDGNYVYIDTPEEARRTFADEFSSILQTIAGDVKIQVEFNPSRVRRYRLIGYENRDIADQDFRNDTVDAGEIGSGQSATALYEIEFNTQPDETPGDIGTVYVRYRDVDTGDVEEMAYRLRNDIVRERTPVQDPGFFLAASVAEFAEQLRGSEYVGGARFNEILSVLTPVANALLLDDRVQELLLLVQQAQGLPRAR